MKLPASGADARKFVYRTGRVRMGKHGWVAVKLLPGDDLPVNLLKSWIEEKLPRSRR